MRFRLEDVFLPGTEDVFKALPPDTQMEGTILSFSDAGTKPHAFAVVEVVRRETVIVPIGSLSVCQGGEPRGDYAE